MRNYRAQNACHNCRHVFEFVDYGHSGEDFYCTLDAPPRPLCGSVKLGEGPNSKLAREGKYDASKWLDWASARYVEPAGICDAWQPDLGIDPHPGQLYDDREAAP